MREGPTVQRGTGSGVSGDCRVRVNPELRILRRSGAGVVGGEWETDWTDCPWGGVVGGPDRGVVEPYTKGPRESPVGRREKTKQIKVRCLFSR